MDSIKSFLHKIAERVTLKGIVGLLWIVGTEVMFLMACIGYFKGETTIQTLCLTGMTNGASFILGYYFGTSESSKKKDDTMKSLIEQNSNNP